MTVADVGLGQAGDDARGNAHGQIAFVQHRGQAAAVQSPASVLAGLRIVYGVGSAGRVTVLAVVAYLVVDVGQNTFNGSQFIARHGHTVEPEIFSDPQEIGVVGLCIDGVGPVVGLLRPAVFRCVLQHIKIVRGFFQTCQGRLQFFRLENVLQILVLSDFPETDFQFAAVQHFVQTGDSFLFFPCLACRQAML